MKLKTQQKYLKLNCEIKLMLCDVAFDFDFTSNLWWFTFGFGTAEKIPITNVERVQYLFQSVVLLIQIRKQRNVFHLCVFFLLRILIIEDCVRSVENTKFR